MGARASVTIRAVFHASAGRRCGVIRLPGEQFPLAPLVRQLLCMHGKGLAMDNGSPVDVPIVAFDNVSLAFDDNVVLRDIEDVTCVAVTHQLRDAFYVATHQAVRQGGTVAIVPLDDRGAAKAGFIMLRDGRVYFDGTGAQLRASTDPYLKRFLADPSRALIRQAA